MLLDVYFPITIERRFYKLKRKCSPEFNLQNYTLQRKSEKECQSGRRGTIMSH